MISLERYKEAYVNKNIQFIVIDFEGVILESDDTFITVSKGGFINDIHPFFTSFTAILDAPEESITYNCVHIEYLGKEFITDIKMIKKDNSILLVIYDLTDHYISYQQIAQARNESIINSELVVLRNLELEERERFKNAFIRNFSHELRNPLTGIISITNIIEGTNLTAEQQQMVNFLKESNSNLKLLLDDIMSLSMISSGKLHLREKVFNLYDLLQLIEFTYKTKADQRTFDFKLDYDQKVPELVEGDRLRLFQIITNLLDNAFKFSEKGKVVLEVKVNQKRANKASIRFKVSDNGVGIPREKIDSIFESFTQLNGTGAQQGSGLGLSIVKGLLELMDSSIRVESTVGKGSEFYFDLTLKFPLALRSKPILINTNEDTIIRKTKGEPKIKLLMVEDDERIQLVLFKALMDTNMFYIDLVNDGALVFEQVTNNNYDVILMDVDLPNIPGDHLTKLIRDFPFKDIKNIPIIGITANAFEEQINDYLNIGMNAVVPKPFNLQELVDTVLMCLKK
ncbi:MAG: response regulator [Maribacter sp.]|nr:response regulator [Maribacter sp.]